MASVEYEVKYEAMSSVITILNTIPEGKTQIQDPVEYEVYKLV